MITMEPVAATQLSVLFYRRAATLHPMGEVVRPHLQSVEAAEQIAELVAPPTAMDDRTPDTPLLPAVDGPPGVGALVPGMVDVRLLSMTPRLDGLQDDLPPDRARRAVELVAYLALHQPDLITSDRLRTRVLGSSDADAASKTLFNTAYAAPSRHGGRRARRSALSRLGRGEGLYQRVTPCDHRRAARLMRWPPKRKVQSDPFR